MSVLLTVIAGHGAGDCGAVNANGTKEAERVRVLASAIKTRGGASVRLMDTNVNWYRDAWRWDSMPKDAPIVELHMDSADGNGPARGSHVIIPAGYGGADAQDTQLASLLATLFPGRSVQVDERGDLANCNRAKARGLNYRLVENGFVDDDQDLNTFNSRVDEIADFYLRTFGIVPSANASATVTTTPPAYSLALDGVFGYYSVLALQEFLRAKGYYGDGLALDGVFGYYTVLALQEFLNAEDYYVGNLALDGGFGYYTVLAWQEYLRARGFYGEGLSLDGDFGYYNVLAVQEWLRAEGYYN